MTNTRRSGKRQRRISVRSVRRSEPDVRRLSRALINHALAQAADEAAARAQSNEPRGAESPKKGGAQ